MKSQIDDSNKTHSALGLAASFKALRLALTFGGAIPALIKAAQGAPVAVAGASTAAAGASAATLLARGFIAGGGLAAVGGAYTYANAQFWERWKKGGQTPFLDPSEGAVFGQGTDAPRASSPTGHDQFETLFGRLTAALGNLKFPESINLNGETQLTGNVTLNMAEFGTFVARIVAKGISEARSIQGSTGARPDRSAPAYP